MAVEDSVAQAKTGATALNGSVEGTARHAKGAAYAGLNGSGGTSGTERTLGQLVAQATQDVSEIVRAEIALAKAEIAVDVKNGAIGGGMFGAAGYLGFLASILLVIAAGYGLRAAGLPAWAAFLVLAVVLLLLAGILALIGRSRFKKVGPPKRAIANAQATLAAVKPSPRGR